MADWVFAVEPFPSTAQGGGGREGGGGAKTAIRTLVAALSAAGRPVQVVTGRAAAARVRGGLLAAFFPVPGARLYYPHGGSWVAWERANRASAEGAYRWFQAVRSRVSPRQRRAAAEERRLLSSGNGNPPDVVAISRRVAEDLSRDYGLSRGRLHVIANGVDTGFFHPDPAARAEIRRRRGWKGAFVCLFAAHNFRLKGLAGALSAAAVLARDRSFRWVVVGKGDTRPYERLARARGCAGAVEFLGAAADPRPLYAGCDCLVQPTFYDPCSLTTLEALACGLPVVTSAENGAGEVLSKEAGRVVADPRDAEGFAEAIRSIRSAGEGIRRSARAVAETRSLSRWAAEMMAVMDEVARK